MFLLHYLVPNLLVLAATTLLMIMIMITSVSGQEPEFISRTCVNRSPNATADARYKANLGTLLSSLSSKAADHTFYNDSYSGIVYGLYLCRGDITSQTCQNCVSSATTKQCPSEKGAIIWFDLCTLRYSDENFFGWMDASPGAIMWNSHNTTLLNYDDDPASLMYPLIPVTRKTKMMYSYGADVSQSKYGMMQCSRDITRDNCSICLGRLMENATECCKGKIGWRVYAPSCNIRYELFPFNLTPQVQSIPGAIPPPPQLNALTPVLSPTPTPTPSKALPPPPPTPPPPAVAFAPPPSITTPSTNTTRKEGNRNRTLQTAIIIVVPVSIVLVVITFACAFFHVKKRKDANKILDSGSRQGGVHHAGEDRSESDTEDSLRFDFVTIRAATDDFSDANKLGQGGFGTVYKGKLSNGQEIAVKRLIGCSKEGEIQFKNEIILVARLQHKNLVRLIGFCLEEKEMLVIYEFVPNASLDRFIFDPNKRLQLNWETRYKIIVGIARGLLYLHEDSQLRIIHHDLKAGNVLLDVELNPKIADFGLARLFLVDQSQGNYTKRIAGTFGYMPPEYVNGGKFSAKTDVFSFGVLILEIVTGVRNGGSDTGEHLVSYAWKKWKEGKALSLIDPTISGGSKSDKMRIIHIGLLCVQENVANRPTVASIVLMLTSFSMSLPFPSKPAFFMQSSEDSDQSSKHRIDFSINETSITELCPR